MKRIHTDEKSKKILRKTLKKNCLYCRYDQEEGGAQREGGEAPFVGDDALFKKREEALAQRVMRRDGTQVGLGR